MPKYMAMTRAAVKAAPRKAPRGSRGPRSSSPTPRSTQSAKPGEIAAVLVERNDGTCTVLWAGGLRGFSSRPEEWPSREEARQAVQLVIDDVLLWTQMAPGTWSVRAG